MSKLTEKQLANMPSYEEPTITNAQLNEVCDSLRKVLENTKVHDPDGLIKDFRNYIEFYNVVIKPEDHPDHPANDPALHSDDYAQALDDHFLSLQEK